MNAKVSDAEILRPRKGTPYPRRVILTPEIERRLVEYCEKENRTIANAISYLVSTHPDLLRITEQANGGAV